MGGAMAQRANGVGVSVVIPSYNHEPFLRETLRSVEAQTHRPLEIVVVDDGSTDGSTDLLRRIVPSLDVDSALLIEQENAGAHAAIMRGIEASTADVIAVLNSDDSYHPRRLETLLPYIVSYGHQLAFSGVAFIDRRGNEMPSDDAWPLWYRRCLEAAAGCPTTGFAVLLNNFSVTSGNFLFTRSLYESVGGFSEYRFCHDWDFLIRAVYYSEPAFTPDTLLNYRIHDTNTTESVRELLEAEATDALRQYIALLRRNESPNPLAPCRQNWPRIFDRIAMNAPLPFAPDRTLSDLWTELQGN